MGRVLILEKIIFQIKIGLLLAVRRKLPLRQFIKTRKIGIRLIRIINLRDVRSVTIRQKLPVHRLSARHKHILTFILLQLQKKLLQRMHHRSALNGIYFIRRQNNIHPVFERLLLRKTFQRIAPHYNHFPLRHLQKQFLITRNFYQKRILIPNRPIPVHCRNNIHITSLPHSFNITITHYLMQTGRTPQMGVPHHKALEFLSLRLLQT